MMENLLNEKQVGEKIGVSQRTLQQWRLCGRGPKFARISGRCVRYLRIPAPIHDGASFQTGGKGKRSSP
jgi:predicted DNA-binding transcriptional regulator AlpA